MKLSLETDGHVVTIITADNVLTLDEMLVYVGDLLRGHGYHFDGQVEIVDDDEPRDESE